MRRFPLPGAVLLCAILSAPALVAETRYLTFQVWPAMPGYPGIPPLPGRLALSKGQMAEFVRSIVKAVGTTGDQRDKLGFAVGPLCFDMPDDEIRGFIRDAFAVARENDVALALHIDDSMSWGHRTDLLSDPGNLETSDWAQTPNTGRSLAWGPKPLKFPPQMSYNAPAVVAAAKERAALIGSEIARGLATLKSAGTEHLFAGVIAGSETQLGRDFETGRPLGFRALARRGFSEKVPPPDPDAERAAIVREWIQLWARALSEAGAPREKIYCHIAFTDQGLRKADGHESYAEKIGFGLSDIAFDPAYRPGFSTYPEGRTFTELYAALHAHGSPGWISAEGTNVSPTGMPGEPSMETYLARILNHGGVLVNLFSWGIGGEEHRDNFFRRATENPEALAAYAKFLRHETLRETPPAGFSPEAFQQKMHRIQDHLSDWARSPGQQQQATLLTQRLMQLIKERRFEEASSVADDILAAMSRVSGN